MIRRLAHHLSLILILIIWLPFAFAFTLPPPSTIAPYHHHSHSPIVQQKHLRAGVDGRLSTPFDDIVPRITAAEKRAQQRAREEAQREREEAERRREPKRLNVGLLSFGEDADEEAAPVTITKKVIVRPDLVDDPQATALAVPDFVSKSSALHGDREDGVGDPLPHKAAGWRGFGRRAGGNAQPKKTESYLE
ncbi:hypothetical protein R3P38DRAFT_3219025 [Favolaschia claudopus]|uniref:Uncharacterized protein n=1 Tax=Favolaschia claudopus TaxID=2862362 RepID=A0AAW0A279_9AGAR